MDRFAQVTLKHLRCFMEVYHLGSLAEAALSLGITQSAASRRLSDLEEVLQRPLFAREGRRLRPKAEALLLLRYAEAALLKLNMGLDLVTGTAAAARPVLAIGALPTVAATLVPKAILQLRQIAPRLLIRVETGSGDQLLPRLRAGQLDAVVGRMAPVDQLRDLRFDPLFQDRLAFVVRTGHPLTKTLCRLADFAAFPMILPPPTAVVRPIVEGFLIARGIALPEDRMETTADAVAAALLRASDAIWAISRGVAEAAVAEGRLVFLPVDTADTIGAIGVTRRDDDETETELTLLLDTLEAQVRAT